MTGDQVTVRDRGSTEQTQLGDIDCDSDIWAGFLVEVAFKLCLKECELGKGRTVINSTCVK